LDSSLSNLFPSHYSKAHMQVIENKALMFVTRKAESIRSLIPKSRVLETNGDKAKVLVHWGMDEVQVLRNLGIKDVPGPILGRYNWPGVFTPFDHQRVTADFLVSNMRCYNFSEPGTGKTSAAAWAADYLMSQGRVKRVLVVCPVSIMDTAWRADMFRTIMHRTVAIAQGDRKQRARIIAGDYEVVVINFDGVAHTLPELVAGGFDLVIVDEANGIKNVSTRRWKALDAVVKPDTRVWLMTGTPAAQSPEDAYGLAKLCRPDTVPRYAGAWKNRVLRKITQFKWVPVENAQKIVFDTLQPAIRFTKEECLDLPDMLYVTRDVPLTSQQQKYYDAIKKEMMTMAAGEEITAVNAAVMMQKLLQLASGAIYADNGEVIQFDMSSRFAELVDVIDQSPHKVLVFVPFRHSLDMLEEGLLAKYPGAVECIHGGVAGSKRAEIIKRFQTEDTTRVLLLQPQATAHGITLTRADQVVWWGPTSSAETYIQANARAHRAGQTNKVTVTHLQGSPVERRLFSMLQGKLDTHQTLVEMYKQEIA
jgi:SNF2 family DNA or RNA helicase